MGSFNTSCFVSQQIIVPGASAAILPIMQRSTFKPVELVLDGKEFSCYGIASSVCYPTAFWDYSGPIIWGTYDDYGRFELHNTPENKNNLVNFFNILYSRVYITELGENECHEISFNIRALYNSQQSYSFEELEKTWDEIWNVAHEHRLFIKDYKGWPRPLQFAVMHQEAADYLVNTVSKFKRYDGASFEQKTYFKKYVQQKLKTALEVCKDKDEELANRMLSFAASRISFLDNYYIGEGDAIFFWSFYNTNEQITDLIQDFLNSNQGTTEISNDLIDKMFEILKYNIQHRYINAGLDYFNLKLSPMVYAGQDYSNDTGKAYAKMIKTVSSKIFKLISDDEM